MSSTSSGSSRPRRAAPAARRLAGSEQRSAEQRSGAGPGAVLRRQLDALNRHDLDALMDLYAEDAVLEFPASPAVAGRETIRQAFARFFRDWDERITVTRAVVAGTSVAAEGTAEGRHRTLHLRIPGRTPTRPRDYRHGFAVFLEVRRGKIRRHRVYFDSRDLVRQLLGS